MGSSRGGGLAHSPAVHLSLQDFVEAGLSESPPELRRAGEAVVRAVKTGRWDGLPADAKAAALVMCKPDQALSWLLGLAVEEPVEATSLAVRSAQLYLRFAVSNGALVRVLDVPLRKPSGQLPPPTFWLTLRRSFDARPALRRGALAALPPLDDLRVRAAVAFVFSEEPSLWTEAHRRAAQALEDPGDEQFLLFATVRGLPAVADVTSWPPQPKLLEGLSDALLLEAQGLTHDEHLAQQRRRRASVQAAQRDVRPLFERITAPASLATLAEVTPTEGLCAQAEALVDELGGAVETQVLRRSFIEGWRRQLAWDGPPRDAPWRSPWERPAKKKDTSPPPPAPPLEPGEWERSWRPRPPLPEVQLAWSALQGRAEVRPWEVSLLLELGPVILPRLRAWARREPALLSATQAVDDGGLDEALLLAWSSRRTQLGLAAREFARRHPERARKAGIRLCCAPLAKERTAGALVLRALRRDLGPALDALEPAQRSWVEAQLSGRPQLPARRPPLPAFLKWSALPPVTTADGARALGEEALVDLVAVFKASPADDGAALLQVTAGLAPESLEALAGVLFHQWLASGAPPKEKWALTALAHFPSDTWARVVGALCQQWAQGGFPARAQDAVAVLGRMGTRAALREVHRLATRIRALALRARAKLAFQEAATRLGLSGDELEDRLVPEVGPLDGATLGVDGSLEPTLTKEGRAVPAPEALQLAARALKPAVARLERVMCDGPGFGAVHFTETWGMHPLLRALAVKVLWGAFQKGARRGLFVPGDPPQGDDVPLDDDTTVRPVHPLELSPAELERARAWLPGKQPFEQLERACFVAGDLRARLEALLRQRVHAAGLLQLERLGWERGASADGGAWLDVTRRGDGWHLTLHFEPGIWAVDPRASERQVITGFALEPAGRLSPRVASELQRDLVRCFLAR